MTPHEILSKIRAYRLAVNLVAEHKLDLYIALLRGDEEAAEAAHASLVTAEAILGLIYLPELPPTQEEIRLRNLRSWGRFAA